MAAALAPLRTRMPYVPEREILRVAAGIAHEDAAAGMEAARCEVLTWAQNRCGEALPREAWEGESFDTLRGGRITLAVRLQPKGQDLWALRGDDPDKNVPGRIWTTEVTIGRPLGESPLLSLRLLVNSPEQELDIEPAVPGLLRQITEVCGLHVGGFRLRDAPWVVNSEREVEELINFLESPRRRLPVIVASGDERVRDPGQPAIRAASLARATLGLAHVVVLPAAMTYAVSDAFGKARSVFFGAIRIYMPGFDSASDPHSHRLILRDTIDRDPAACVRDLRRFVAVESLTRTRLGGNVLPFNAVRSAALRIQQEERARMGASDSDQLDTARKRIEALEAQVAELTSQGRLSFDLARETEDRALVAENQLLGARARIQYLEQMLTARGQAPDADIEYPRTWSDFADWCDENFPSRLVLAPAARAGIKKAEFDDVELAARCTIWLATTCRERRMNGGGSLANIPIFDGIENAPCGGDTFRFDFQGRRLNAEWHVKNGGNTRHPTRCLRIYYAWDDAAQQVVIAHMPGHRRTGAT